MAAKYHRVKRRGGGFLTGIYYYESTARPRVNGHPDRCFHISFKVDGKKKWEKVGWESEGYTSQVAQDLRAQRMKAIRHGEEVKTAAEIRRDRTRHDRPLSVLKDLYFNSEHGRKMKGRQIDINRWENHLEFIEQKKASELTMLDIERIKRNARKKGLSPQSLKHILTLLNRVVNFGSRHGYSKGLTFKIAMPRVDNEVIRYLTEEQVERFLKVLDEWPNQEVARMVKVAFFTGMRKREIFKLRVKDVDFRQKLITIRDAKSGKNESIPMSSLVAGILQEQVRWARSRFPDTPYMFPGRNGGERRECTAVRRIKEAAGLPDFFRPFHDLRHHFAVQLASSGKFTLDMIGELLTHKDLRVTRRYAAFLPGAKKEAAEQASKLLIPKHQDVLCRIKGHEN